MGIKERFMGKLEQRRQRKRTSYEMGREERLLRLKVAKENYKLRAEERALQSEVKALRSKERNARLVPVKRVLKEVKSLAKAVKPDKKQQAALFGNVGNKELFQTTKNADQLLFGTPAKKEVTKKLKRKKVVYYE